MPNPPDIAGLKVWYKSDVGVFSDNAETPATHNGLIRWWYNQSGSGVNPLFEFTDEIKPRYDLEETPFPSVSFHITNNDLASFAARLLRLPTFTFMLNPHSFTAIIVVKLNSVERRAQLFSFGVEDDLALEVEHGFLYVRDNGTKIPTGVRISSRRSVIVWRSNALSNSVYVNSIDNIGTIQAVTGSNYESGTVSSNSGVYDGWFDVYEYVVYDNDIGSNNVEDLLEYAIERHEVPLESDFTKRIIIDGDFTSEGAGDILNSTFWRRTNPPSTRDLLCFANGTKTLAIASTIALQYIDPQTSANRLEDWLFCKFGVYDLIGLRTGQQIYDDIKNYCRDRKNAGVDKIVVWTCPIHDTQYQANRDFLNDKLRADFGVATSNQYVFAANGDTLYADYLIDTAAHPDIGAYSPNPSDYWVVGAGENVFYTAAGRAIEAELLRLGIPELFILQDEISVPVQPVAAHLGQGVIQLRTNFPLEINFKEFEVHAAPTLDGEYMAFSNNRFSTKDGFIYNFPLGENVYLRIRSVSHTNITSAWVQVKRGVLLRPTVTMQCRAVRGSLIPQGALFTAVKDPNRIIGFTADEDVQF